MEGVMNQKINCENAPAAIGPYSQAVQSGNFLFLSGMMPIDPVSGVLVEDDVVLQSKQIMKNIDALLKNAGYTVEDVVKTSCFLTDMGNFGAFNEIYGNYFTNKPARSCVAVRELPKKALVEVEVIACK